LLSDVGRPFASGPSARVGGGDVVVARAGLDDAIKGEGDSGVQRDVGGVGGWRRRPATHWPLLS